MATPVEMPRLGNTVEECLLAKWRKQKGEAVAEGEVLADIETDKATFEVPAPASGVLLDTFFAEGDLVPVLTTICAIGAAGESSEAFRPRPAEAAAPAAERQEIAAPAERGAGGTGEMRPSPRARRFAKENDFHPQPVAGSGPGGRVLEDDLRRLYQSAPRASSLARARMSEGHEIAAPGSGLGGMLRARDLAEPAQPLSSLREKIARRMRESLAATAQYTLNASADATSLLRLRRKIKELRTTPDININDMVLFCTVKALIEMPELNAELAGGKLRPHAAIHLGFACDTPKGLLAPVVRNCESLSLTELARQVKQLAEQAGQGTIGPDDLTGATFTVSNLGGLGIESFTPILNPPQVALLGVNKIDLKAVRREGKVEFAEHIGLSLTCDHQVIDGAPGARFLALVKQKIESFRGDGECTI
ncbi:MAG: 2-oxo acid dehydrogenase subunit E2 [Acidobacteria bacterium]|nr:2-oxo acid dehydrogenase subunit E2 [Acidobacteriota bacterium]